MGYPYSPSKCKGALCAVHGDERDTSMVVRRDAHWSDDGAACACEDGHHAPGYRCYAQRALWGILGRQQTKDDLPPGPWPCCGE